LNVWMYRLMVARYVWTHAIEMTLLSFRSEEDASPNCIVFLFSVKQNWTAAELYKPIEQRRNRHWAWTQFTKTLPLPEDVRKRLARGEQVTMDITSKAMNSDFNLQPERMEPYWNARGVCINHWYHVKVRVFACRHIHCKFVLVFY